MTDRVVNSAMKYRTQVAFVDGLMKDLGLPLDNIGSAERVSFRNFPATPARTARQRQSTWARVCRSGGSWRASSFMASIVMRWC